MNVSSLTFSSDGKTAIVLGNSTLKTKSIETWSLSSLTVTKYEDIPYLGNSKVFSIGEAVLVLDQEKLYKLTPGNSSLL
jgi:hypothetical protein